MSADCDARVWGGVRAAARELSGARPAPADTPKLKLHTLDTYAFVDFPDIQDKVTHAPLDAAQLDLAALDCPTAGFIRNGFEVA